MKIARILGHMALMVAIYSSFSSQLYAAWPTLDEYLQQVRKGSKNYQGTLAAQSSYEMRLQEGDLIFSPQFFASGQLMDDKRQTTSLALLGNETITTSVAMGVEKITSFGKAKISYSLNHIDMQGTSPAAMPTPNFYMASPSVELLFPLWKNFLGIEAKRARDMMRYSAQGNSRIESFKGRMLLLEAELAYWRLSLAREMVKIQEDILQRNIRIKNWSARRADLQLGERADLLQAQAAVAGRKLELTMAQEELKGAIRNFNTLRGSDAETVEEGSTDLPPALFSEQMAAQIYQARADLLGVQDLVHAATLNAQNNKDKYKPTVDLFSSLSLNGKNVESGQSLQDSFSSDHAVGVVGVRVNIPLDGGIIREQQASVEKEIAGAGLGLQYRQYKEKRDFEQLRAKWQDSRLRLQMLEELEKIQRSKVSAESDRHQRGRSTTYQVILFEQDLAGAQLLRLKTQGEMIAILAQLKTYNLGGGE